MRGRPSSRWKFGALALIPAALLGLLVLGVPGEHGCGGEIGALPPQADRALPCDTPLPEVAAAAPKTLVYLATSGLTLTAGADDATKNVSQVLATKNVASLEVPAAGYDAATWKSIEACIKQRFAAFDIAFTTERPAQGPYLMAVFGGAGSALGFGPEIKGTAPIDSTGCKTSPSAVALVFSAQLGADPTLHCEIAAQELAHAFSADHVMLAEDAMSYLAAGSAKTFRDAAAPCGEFSERACVCGRPSQNSYQLLMERLGPARAAADAAPPQVSASWTPSRSGSATIAVTALDDRSVASVELTIETDTQRIHSTCGDGQVTCTPNAGGWTFSVTGVPDGARFSVAAQDGVGNLSATPTAPLSTAPPTGPALSASVRVLPSAQGKLLWVTAEAPGALAEATLEWTDATGTTQQAMCKGADGKFYLPLAADRTAGTRAFSISARDAAGASARTARQDLALQ